MQTDPKRLLLATCLGAAIACAGLVGCKTEQERTAGMRMDDDSTSKRVKQALTDAPTYKFPDVHVEVFDGIAQLSGFAETKEQKQYAGEVASHVDGVRQLLNDIAVKPPTLVSPTGYSYGRQYPPAPTSSTPPPNTVNKPVQSPANPEQP